MHILTINAGSSSLKAKYFEDLESVASILIEEIGSSSSKATLNYNSQTFSITRYIPTHKEAIKATKELFDKAGISDKLLGLDAIAHRVVHGASLYYKPTRITPQVIKDLKSISHLAPLHNPVNIEAIEIFAKEFTSTPQVAIFDTAFHHTIPSYAHTYALPQDITNKYHIQRYGFHGISYAYTTHKASELLDIAQDSINLISLHLGNGASITAIKDGKSVDTSMGMTPLAGLVMGSRCGDIDVGIIPYLASQGYSIEQIDDILNHQSGLMALFGSNDIRLITQEYYNHNPQAIKTLQIYTYEIVKYIGSYLAVLPKVDAIVFSGGVGENSSLIRELVIKQLSCLNIQLDSKANETSSPLPRLISSPSSSIAVAVIPTNEELQMARESLMVL